MHDSYNESYNLIKRSATGGALYIAACLISAGSYVLMCRFLGLNGGYDSYAVIKASPLKGLTAYLPGIILTAWFAAGLAGRYTMDVLTGTPEGIKYYASGWFFRKLIADFFVTFIIWLPVLALLFVPFGGVVFAFVWILFAAWLGIRLALWLNVSVAENLGLVAAMKRSFVIMDGQILRIMLLTCIPMIIARALAWLLGKTLPGQVVLVYYSRSLLEGAATVFVLGILAGQYCKLRTIGVMTTTPSTVVV